MILRVPEVIHNTCNMGARDLPDMYALSPQACGPRASGIHIRQIPHAHACYNYYMSLVEVHVHVPSEVTNNHPQ